jgi:nucleoside-diphosphate-sugar epimerase
VATISEIITAMREVAPAGQQDLSPGVLGELRGLTQTLAAARPGAAEEHERFLALRQRAIPVPDAELAAWLGGATVLVTGGTGCIGSALMAEVARWAPRRIVSVSRGRTHRWPRVAPAEYLHADIRDAESLSAVFAAVRPDVVFHVAAQRDPGLAELEVHQTVSTNVLGTSHVLAAAEKTGASRVIVASTGKALRPYSREVYTATKRAVEWLTADAARNGTASYAAVRFTHAIDNSIIYDRLVGWCQDGVIRLHDPDIMFYVQSALEAAQLMLVAGLSARRGELRAHAITDLGYPVSLLDLALGVLLQTGSHAPVYFSGYDAGYESMPFPGLYDPLTAGDVSPLLNAFEAPSVARTVCPATDEFSVLFSACPGDRAPLRDLREACGTGQAARVRDALDALSWWLLDSMLNVVPRDAVDRMARLTAQFEGRLSPEYQRILGALREHAAAA